MPSSDAVVAIGGFMVLVGIWLATLGAWITHIVWSFSIFTSVIEQTMGIYILAVIGIFFAPIGVIHGVMLWFS